MPRINLLPWRTELRQRRKKEFLVALAGTLVVAAGVVYLSKLTVQGWTSSQQGRNEVLRSEIADIDKQIKEIEGLQTQRERLLARMQVITQLQRSRPEIVHLFDELVDAMPEGVNLTEVVQQTNRIELHGVAQSSTRVSALMRNIDNSDFLKEPGLGIVESVASGVDRNSSFQVFAQQVSMVAPDGTAAEGAAQ
ncbi:MAG TPA: PilN domain-containing protein [Gammaproteobacteria bacterium]|nr:PilN domain-containing protein [Gammaproteobacteria bacterium]